MKCLASAALLAASAFTASGETYICQRATPMYDARNVQVGSAASGTVVQAVRDDALPGNWLVMTNGGNRIFVDGERFITADQAKANADKELIQPTLTTWDPVRAKQFTAQLVGMAFGEVLFQDKNRAYFSVPIERMRASDQDYIDQYQAQLSDAEKKTVADQVLFLQQERKNAALRALNGKVNDIDRDVDGIHRKLDTTPAP